MKTKTSVLFMVAALAGCLDSPEYRVVSCVTASSSEVVCIEHRYRADAEPRADLSRDDWVAYSNAMFYFYKNEISADALTQVYVDVLGGLE